MLTTALAARGRQQHFLLAYGVGALIGIVSTTLWVPMFGLIGAVAAAYAAEFALIAIQGVFLVYLR